VLWLFRYSGSLYDEGRAFRPMLSPDQPSGGRCEQRLRRTEVSVGGLWVRADNEKTSADRGGQRYDVAHRLHRFNSWCAQSGLPELERLAGTIEACWPEVLGFLLR